MRLEVGKERLEQLDADLLVIVYRPSADEIPLAHLFHSEAPAFLRRDAEGCTWLETRDCATPRALLVSLGEDDWEEGLDGACGDLRGPEIAERRRHELRTLGAVIERECSAAGVAHVVLSAAGSDLDLAPVLEGLVLRSHRPMDWAFPDDPGTGVRAVELHGVSDDEARRYREVFDLAHLTNYARRLADLPANRGRPRDILDRVVPRLEKAGLGWRVIERDEAEELGMGLFLAVARGGASPAMLVIEHDGPRPLLGLVGKGVTHDLGGYNLKRGSQVHTMTYDKAGAMAVIGAMLGIARLELPMHVIGICPLVENALDGPALKPGEILRAMDGTTVYVDNTDAEGRLVMADALTWLESFDPDLVLDLATLTGSAQRALGEPYAPVFANSDLARELVVSAASETGELVWPMPIHELHDRELGHARADLKNTGRSGMGSACTAAAFLRHFTRYPWAHVDMGGKAQWEDPRDVLGVGGTGFGTRLLVAVARHLANRDG